jgi:hypothetical protein
MQKAERKLSRYLERRCRACGSQVALYDVAATAESLYEGEYDDGYRDLIACSNAACEHSPGELVQDTDPDNSFDPAPPEWTLTDEEIEENRQHEYRTSIRQPFQEAKDQINRAAKAGDTDTMRHAFDLLRDRFTDMVEDGGSFTIEFSISWPGSWKSEDGYPPVRGPRH